MECLYTVVSSFYYRVIAWYKMFFSCVIQLYLHYFQRNMIENEHFDSHFLCSTKSEAMESSGQSLCAIILIVTELTKAPNFAQR